MFWVRICLAGQYFGLLDTGATISIVAKKILLRGDLKNNMPTAAIRMGDGHVVHNCGVVKSTCLWALGALPIGST